MMTYSKAGGPVSSVGCVGHGFEFWGFGCEESRVKSIELSEELRAVERKIVA